MLALSCVDECSATKYKRQPVGMRNHEDQYAAHRPVPKPPVAKYADQKLSRHNGRTTSSMMKVRLSTDRPTVSEGVNSMLRPAAAAGCVSSPMSVAETRCDVRPHRPPTADEASLPNSLRAMSASSSGVRFAKPQTSRECGPTHAQHRRSDSAAARCRAVTICVYLCSAPPSRYT